MEKVYKHITLMKGILKMKKDIMEIHVYTPKCNHPDGVIRQLGHLDTISPLHMWTGERVSE